MKNTPSLMEAPVVATPILDQFKKALTPSTGKEPTLEEKLSAFISCRGTPRDRSNLRGKHCPTI
jgi:hypothetical protein